MSAVSRHLVPYAAASLIALAFAGAQTPGSARHVILITLDGMRGDYIAARDPYDLKIPRLRELIARGSTSEHTISVFPTLTGTAHTSLVTGVRAIRHGILGNNQFDPSIWAWDEDNYDRQPPYRDHALINAPTLWGAARTRGLKTAAVAWPQTFGGPIDYALDILPAQTTADSHARIVKSASAGWLDTIESKLGTIAALDARMADHWKAIVAAAIVRDFRPAFMAVHFSITDGAQHALGSATPEALVAVEESDQNIGIYEARYPGRFRLLSRAELDRMGADREARLGIEPTIGYVLDARLGPPFAIAHGRAAGHGYSPELPDMQTGLIIAGAGIRRGVVLPVTQTIDIAPTIAQILGLDLGSTDGRPIVGVLEREKK